MKWQRWALAMVTWFSVDAVDATPTSVVVYGDDAYPPYSYEENGQAKGIYADILSAVFARMPDYQVTVSPIPWKRGLKMLKTGKGFALFPPYYYPDKRPYIFPYSTPILPEEVVVFCHPDRVRGRPLTRWPDDYFGLKIGLNEAFEIGGQAFWRAVRRVVFS